MTTKRPSARAAGAFQAVMAVGFLVVLAANLPGHLSYDSVIALYEGRTGVRQTWAPAAVSWIMGGFDRLATGTGLYVTASAALLFAALMSLPALRPRVSRLGAALGVAFVLTPQVLIYQGVVWKDVMFANLAVAGFIALAHAARRWGGWKAAPALCVALACLSLAMLTRQNGAIVAVLGAAVLGWTARGGGWKAVLGWSLGALVALGLLAAAIDAAAQPQRSVPKLRANAGMRILQHYDIAGAVAHEPGMRLEILGAASPEVRDAMIAEAPRFYSPERIDSLGGAERLRKRLWRTPDAAISAQWREIIIEHPGAYLAHRAAVFRQVFLTPVLDHCLPVHVGVSGPPAMLAELGLTAGIQPRDAALAGYARRFFPTPVYSHLSYAIAALAAAGLLMLRRDPADWVVAALMLGALGFAASFFVVSVACDYRYLYFLDLAAMVGALYLALDPPFRRARQGLSKVRSD